MAQRGKPIPARLQAVLRALHQREGYSLRALARAFRLHRATVAKYATDQSATKAEEGTSADAPRDYHAHSPTARR